MTAESGLQLRITARMETYLNNPWRDDGQNEVEPNVCKDAPESCDKKHSQVFDLARLSIWNY